MFFRESIRRAADATGVAGWVRNLPDGIVEVVVEGQVDAITQMVGFCRIGPPDANVERIEAFDEPAEGLHGFVIRLTPPRE